MHTIVLNGAWSMAYAEIGAWSIAEAQAALGAPDALTCPVPGSVHQGLMAAGIIPDPMVAAGAQACWFMEGLDFWLETSVRVDRPDPYSQALLRFDGIDLDADVYVNGQLLMHCDNAFLRWEADARPLLVPGRNTVTVRVNEGLAGVRHKDIGYMKYSWNQEEPCRTWLRKPQYCYGWDWAKRLSTCGIWQGVTLLCAGAARLGDVQVVTKLSSDHAVATLDIHPDLTVQSPGRYAVRAQLYGDERYAQGTCVAEAEAENEGALGIELQAPELWWPNGEGLPYLYTLKLQARDAQGNLLDECVLSIGIRTLSFEEGLLEDGSHRFAVSVNGRPIFAKGANWVPIDQLAGHAAREKYFALVREAAEMNMNLLRVWGGGIYETEAFFDACDRHGIIVWHDFMFACGYYPDFDEGFVDSVAREAAYQVKRLRNRACLIGWSGNNENHAMYEGLVKHQDPDAVFYGQRLYEEILPDIVRRHDLERSYRPSSPYGGAYADDPTQGDQHLWAVNQIGNPQYMDMFAYVDTPVTFLSEFGMLAPMNLETLKRCLDEDQQYPQSPQWKYHSNIGDYFDVLYETFYGVAEASKRLPLASYILAGQALQAECMAYAFTQLRARWPHCSGALLWMYSDCYPTSGWTFVDYYLNRKALYYYTKRAFAPACFAFSGYQPNRLENMAKAGAGAVDISLANDGAEALTGTYHRTVLRFDGQILAEAALPVTVPAQSVLAVERYDPSTLAAVPEELVILTRLEMAQGIACEGRYFAAPFGRLALPAAQISIARHRVPEGLLLTLTADSYVWLFHLQVPEGIVVDDNDFDLLPGIPRTIRLSGPVDPEMPVAYETMNGCLAVIREERI